MSNEDLEGFEYEGDEELTDEEIAEQAIIARRPKVAPKLKPKNKPKAEPEEVEEDEDVEVPEAPKTVTEETEPEQPLIGDGGLFQLDYKLDKENFVTQEGIKVPILEAIRDACNKVDVLYRIKLAELQKKRK